MNTPPWNARFDPAFSVLDETADYIVVDKPAPLQVHPSVPGSPPTLLDGLQQLLAFEIANGASLSIINRLDRETSGVVIVAKRREVARDFHQAMEARKVEKAYVALVWGWPERDRFSADGAIRRMGEFAESEVWVRQAVHPGGAAAQTEFEVVERAERETSNGDRFALVRAVPRTGRMHQIRVHLADCGFPIVGDKIYGVGPECYLEFIETGWTDALARRLLLPRQALHCERMAVPGVGEWSAPVPSSWTGGLQAP